MFDPSVLRRDSVPAYKSRDKLIDMDIDDFLRMAKPLDYPVTHKEEDLRKSVNSGERIRELPILFVDTSKRGVAKVDGHEGRHRARLMKELGFTSMPVVLRTSGLRWSEQEGPSKFDYYPEWPEYLVGESGARIKFPVLREDAMKPY